MPFRGMHVLLVEDHADHREPGRALLTRDAHLAKPITLSKLNGIVERSLLGPSVSPAPAKANTTFRPRVPSQWARPSSGREPRPGRAMPNDYGDSEKLLTKGEVAQLCRVEVRTVDRWLIAGKIRCYRTPSGRVLFRRDDVLIAMGRAAAPGCSSGAGMFFE